MHTLWKGSISFGLVNIPIKMFAATEDKDIRFRYIHKECHTPIKYEKVCPTCNKNITEGDIVRGYEYEPGRFVILDQDDFESLKSAVQSRSIEILDFVNLEEIDPIYFAKSYYLSPQDNNFNAYNLLKKVMQDTKKIAVAKVSIRNKQSLAVLRIFNDILIMETIFYPDEIRATSLVPGLPEETAEINEKEIDIATQLVENLTEPFDPKKYTDDYRVALHNLINKKIEGKDIEVAPEAPERNVIDLMEALKASVKETKKPAKPKKKTASKRKTG